MRTPEWPKAESVRDITSAANNPPILTHGYVFHEDPGHGWLQVRREELIQLGIADKISPYSYQSSDGATVYLEEDCDVATFMRARGTVYLDDLPGYRMQHHRYDAPMRAMARYQAARS